METFSGDRENFEKINSAEKRLRIHPDESFRLFVAKNRKGFLYPMTSGCLHRRSGEALRDRIETLKNSGITLNGKQVQLNSNVLPKKDSEFYSSIRFKSNARKGESQPFKS